MLRDLLLFLLRPSSFRACLVIMDLAGYLDNSDCKQMSDWLKVLYEVRED